jgi:hypothetical protein
VSRGGLCGRPAAVRKAFLLKGKKRFRKSIGPSRAQYSQNCQANSFSFRARSRLGANTYGHVSVLIGL